MLHHIKQLRMASSQGQCARSGVGGDAVTGGQQFDMALEMDFLWPIHKLPTPEEDTEREEGVFGNQTKRPQLPNPPFTTMSAQTGPAERGEGEVEEDKEKLNTMKLEELTNNFPDRDLLPQNSPCKSIVCVM